MRRVSGPVRRRRRLFHEANPDPAAGSGAVTPRRHAAVPAPAGAAHLPASVIDFLFTRGRQL